MMKVSKDVTGVHLNLDVQLHPETILNDQQKNPKALMSIECWVIMNLLVS